MLRQRHWKGALFLFLILPEAMSGAAVAQSNEAYQIFRADWEAASADPKYAAITDPRVRLMAYWRDHPQSQVRTNRTNLGVSKGSHADLSSARADIGSDALVHKDPSNAPKASSDSQFRLLVRQSFADVSIVSAPNPNATAAGASFGYSRDVAGQNVSWTAQGAVIGGYSDLLPNLPSFIRRICSSLH
jgi:hypothetical protein